MNRSFELINMAMGGGAALEDYLRAMLSDDRSKRYIARKLQADGYPVSHETVRRWFVELDEKSREEREAVS